MKKITHCFILSIVSITLLTNCEGKKNTDEKTEDIKSVNTLNAQKKDEHSEEENNLIYESYTLAENLKNDSFFESDITNKEIEVKNIGITSYFIGGDEVTLIGIFYNKEKNIAIPRYENNPPDRGFVPDYFDKQQINYDEKYKSTYSATIRITLKNPKDIRRLQMYIASEAVRNYEYQVDGTSEYRSGFIDLINVKGIFKGLDVDSVYPNKKYEIVNAEIE